MQARSNEHTEFLAYYPEMAVLYNEVKGKYDSLVNGLKEQYEHIKGIPVQKDFAIEACKCKWSAPLFAVRNKKVASIDEFLLNANVDAIDNVL